MDKKRITEKSIKGALQTKKMQKFRSSDPNRRELMYTHFGVDIMPQMSEFLAARKKIQ